MYLLAIEEAPGRWKEFREISRAQGIHGSNEK
jgi:hypothetical protein